MIALVKLSNPIVVMIRPIKYFAPYADIFVRIHALRNIRILGNRHKFFHSEHERVSVLNRLARDITSPEEEVNWHKKVIYNDILYKRQKESQERNLRERTEFEKAEREAVESGKGLPSVTPLFMKCMTDETAEGVEVEKSLENDIQTVQFPLDVQTSVIRETSEGKANEYSPIKNPIDDVNDDRDDKKKFITVEPPKRWFKDICTDEAILVEDERFGTSDPKIPVSDVPCGGCGALLHCTNMTIPGFMPKEAFLNFSKEDLRKEICQRCLFLKEYDVALGINVKQDEYPKILGKIRNQKALAVLMVDLLDFPCSIWPSILDIIGSRRPIFLVGNKMDLLIEDGVNPQKHIKMCLMNALKDVNIMKSNIIHVSLISAKTGYGVERLISDLQSKWGTKGDVYIMGCTNVGKSTLFNTLIQSDYCKTQATDILQRATVSNWPGTTLNLLKFPILRPLKWRVYLREKRLKFTREKEEELRELKKGLLLKQDGFKQQRISLMGFVERTFREETPRKTSLTGLDETKPEFVNSKWCYDTPGVVHRDQILHLLTTPELLKTIPRTGIVPRNFLLRPNQTLFIGGLARLDFISGYSNNLFTVFAAPDLPVTITETKDAEFVYETLMGTKYFAVPEGSEERLKKWPKLLSKEFAVNGLKNGVGAADVVLSSAGWIAISPPAAHKYTLRAWSPEGRGLFLRKPSIIRSSSSYRTRKILNTPAYETSVAFVDDADVSYV